MSSTTAKKAVAKKTSPSPKPQATSSPSADSHTTVAASPKEKQKDSLKQADLHYKGKPKEQDQDFTYPTHTDPNRKLVCTSNYLDDVQRHDAEIMRAKVEDREPDLDNPPATQGTPLLPSYVVRGSVPGDHIVESDVTLPVTVGRIDGEPETPKVQAVPTYSVSKNDLDEQGRVPVGTDNK